MKKTVSWIALALILPVLSGCASDTDNAAASKAAGSASQTVSDILENAAQGEAAVTPEPVPTPEPVGEPVDVSSPDADIDLTRLSGTMVYSEVYDMVYEPESYLGKIVKMQGTFAVYEGETRNYYACLIADATACCAQGIEFVLAEDRSYPEDYPELGSEITVTGVFGQYEEDGYVYIELSDAEMTS